ncbi:hypothetical protein BGZ52_008343, partial [Haplosporangium bisporale]
MRIWISLSGTITPLYYDCCHGILIQLVGRNAYGLFTMKTPAASTFTAASQGQVTPTNSVSRLQSPDQHNLENLAVVMGRWPSVCKTCSWVVDLEPGNALYTPPEFWHEVTSVDHSVSITMPWDMDANELEE